MQLPKKKDLIKSTTPTPKKDPIPVQVPKKKDLIKSTTPTPKKNEPIEYLSQNQEEIYNDQEKVNFWNNGIGLIFRIFLDILTLGLLEIFGLFETTKTINKKQYQQNYNNISNKVSTNENQLTKKTQYNTTKQKNLSLKNINNNNKIII